RGPPYTGPTGQAILAKRVREPIPHLRTLRPELPEFLEQAVTRCLAKSPADRFSTAAEFAAALIPGASRPTVPVSRWRARRGGCPSLRAWLSSPPLARARPRCSGIGRLPPRGPFPPKLGAS